MQTFETAHATPTSKELLNAVPLEITKLEALVLVLEGLL